MVVAAAPVPTRLPPATNSAPEWKALAIAAFGMLIAFAAPQHRPDLLLIGLVASAIGIIWSPLAGACLIGGLLPAFFFGRSIVGPISVTPPGLALLLTWI